MDDIRAVLEDAGIERTSLVSGVGSSYLTILFAATYPERTSSLVLVDGYARVLTKRSCRCKKSEIGSPKTLASRVG